eukprot:TRINITY_DN60803_c0_g1_i1.p1 TRINITY_DN60803_c0_g1~~TRINITY_DN60803_c0_g1_i1.p1  ORF type:complete len:384 (-),score=87.96 TRINITY_DN60803_c0_g1_i1:453-1604(-)
MACTLGSDARVKATGENGKITATNGHAFKTCGKWYLPEDLLVVKEETGALDVDGQQRSFALFNLADVFETGTAQRPALLFVHGLTGDRSKHMGLARRLCRALGIIVMVPDVDPLMSPLGLKEEAAIREATVHAEWLSSRKDVNSKALMLGGFSAGGAVALEVAADLQAKGLQPVALALLDPVPWKRTSDAAMRLASLQGGVLVLQSEPSAFTNFGAFHDQVVPTLASKQNTCKEFADFQLGDLVVLTVNESSHAEAETANTPSGAGAVSNLPAPSFFSGILGAMSGPVSTERAYTFFLFVEAFLADVLDSLYRREPGMMLSALAPKVGTDVRFEKEATVGGGADATLEGIKKMQGLIRTGIGFFGSDPEESSEDKTTDPCPTQ